MLSTYLPLPDFATALRIFVRANFIMIGPAAA
jgi:hypothetical protein